MKCDYGICTNDATTEGFVWTRDSESVSVNACDTHKEESGFFERSKENKN